MKVLVIGGGAKEHALIWKLSRSKHIAKIYCAPGNAGIAGIAECIDMSPHHVDALVDFVKYEWIDLTIVCSETALARGILDIFERNGCAVFGLSREILALNGSRVSSKNFMRQHSIPTPEYRVFSSHVLALDYVQLKGLPLVVKTDGSTGDEGVFLVSTFDDAADILKRIMRERLYGDDGSRVIIEEHVTGERMSLVMIADGGTIRLLGSVHKCRGVPERASSADVTVCGSYSPVASLSHQVEKGIMDRVVLPVHAALSSEGIAYRGFISLDLVVHADSVSLSELKFGFGELEPQVIMPGTAVDMGEAIILASEGRLSNVQAREMGKGAACMGLFSKRESIKGSTPAKIDGLESLRGRDDVFAFHENTLFDDHAIVTPGGVALTVAAVGRTVGEAFDTAYRSAENIHFEGKQLGKDLFNHFSHGKENV